MSRHAKKHARQPAGAEVNLDHELTAGFAHRFVRFKAGQLIGNYGFKRCDRPDLEQELKLRLIERFGQFDPAKSDWPEFVTVVVERHVATLIESQNRLKRSAVVSLSEEDLDEDGQVAELADRITSDHVAALTRVFERSDAERVELEHDVAAVLGCLPDDARRVCEALKSQTVTQVARELGIPRTTINSLVQRLRDVFEAQRVQEFL
jgi:RNA polymerase sigma-70 factor (ECF subfamily)